MSNINGLTKNDFKLFSDLLIKSNSYQLELIRKEVYDEIKKREQKVK